MEKSIDSSKPQRASSAHLYDQFLALVSLYKEELSQAFSVALVKKSESLPDSEAMWSILDENQRVLCVFGKRFDENAQESAMLVVGLLKLASQVTSNN
ncbi:hypothetical protein CL689_06030 [Candidatus Saccharibacteria bacterium]|nr:hypothetical protein [Candidatus Saccharibacteria bacterium]|tara:strand:+ start:59 stop:352 length:294 start_codon:yes stop_codon:yes gene_type:complete